MSDRALPPDLAVAIERLYEVFAGYRFENTAPCACCNSEEVVARIDARLRSADVRELTEADLCDIVYEILPMFGDAADTKTVAPRLLELGCRRWLLGEDRGEYPITALYPSAALHPFLWDEWRDWPDVERDALARFLETLWADALTTGERFPLTDGWWHEALPIAILSVVPDPAPLLDGYRQGPIQARHLAWFLRELRWLDAEGARDLGAIWREDEAKVRRAEIADWLRSAAPEKALRRALRNPASATYRWELVLGLEHVRVEGVIPFDRGRHGSWVPDLADRTRAALLGVDLGEDSYRPRADDD